MSPDQEAKLAAIKGQVAEKQGELEGSEDALYSEAAPHGTFSSKALNALVDAANKLSTLFGIPGDYAKFPAGSITDTPPEFNRLLTMFSVAIKDAVDAGVLEEDNLIDLASIVDDSGIQSLAGRISMAAKSPAFKRFLLRKVKETPEEEAAPETAPDTASEEATDKLFSQRM